MFFEGIQCYKFVVFIAAIDYIIGAFTLEYNREL
ncbi:hypothetical protein ICA_01380 [Bacillus cereus BAG1O-3]|nr:hypothetical protein ICA_01380 [Bacillus cereus BAG1O-3]MCP1394053.1 hypothetical protein [Bacillus cereus]PYE90318.1 hypothetical protein ATL10_102824 [Bacillus sp. 196mf]SFL35001.1 hypothetical protein SAMN04488573_1021460 [Bacillus sp. 5mfcol3.1]